MNAANLNIRRIDSRREDIRAAMAQLRAKLSPQEDGERGVMVFTASVAAFDGQVYLTLTGPQGSTT